MTLGSGNGSTNCASELAFSKREGGGDCDDTWLTSGRQPELS
jgi:hypothetical protein